jgi:aldehyde dehydrogenase (NAD+)
MSQLDNDAQRNEYFLSAETAQAIAGVACFIDGRWVKGEGASIVSLNPTTGRALGEFSAASVRQVDDAARAARRSFDGGSWSNSAPKERGQKLRRLADLMDKRRSMLREVVTADVGMTVNMADPPIDAVHWFADAAERGPDGWYESALAPDKRTTAPFSSSLLIREPIGVVGAINTWNFPFITLVWKMCGALAAGCSVVLQPSPKAALSTFALWRLMEELDLPKGVVNLVLGDAEVGTRISTSPLVDMVSFTGSVKVGAQIMAQAAPTIKKVVLELGGKSAAIVLPGTDLKLVLKPLIDRLIGNAGQRCGATSRMLIHTSQFDGFVAQAAAYLKDIVVGDPREKTTDVGPLIDHVQLRSVQGYVDRALAVGGRIAAGGGSLPARLPGGAFMRPMLLTGLDNATEFCQEEQFGPTGAIIPYDSVDEAVDIANATRYGLNAMVFGSTVEAIAIGRRLRSGTVTINGRGANRSAPWGGYGQSGLGREGGDEGFREFFEVKHLNWLVR